MSWRQDHSTELHVDQELPLHRELLQVTSRSPSADLQHQLTRSSQSHAFQGYKYHSTKQQLVYTDSLQLLMLYLLVLIMSLSLEISHVGNAHA